MSKQLIAFKDLENPIMEAKAMAALLVKFYDTAAVSFASQDEANTFGFAIYDVERRLNALSDQFQGCFDFKDPS